MGCFDMVESIYGNTPDILSQLIRTMLIAKPGHKFIVADFSAIEARVLAWLAGEQWRMEAFKNGEDIYCASASQMFGVPVVKHGINGELRQKGKVAELACGYGGAAGALISMRKLKPELLAENVNAWFADREQSYMIRSMDYGNGRVARALLSDRYRRIDNMEIASAVLPLFAGQADMQVMSCEVTSNRMYLKIVNKRLEMDVVPGDTVQGGVIISNSEVGLNQPEQDGILNYLIQGGDLSQYGLSNAITRASQNVESYDRATALEGIGWQVATMPIQQWKEINSK